MEWAIWPKWTAKQYAKYWTRLFMAYATLVDISEKAVVTKQKMLNET